MGVLCGCVREGPPVGVAPVLHFGGASCTPLLVHGICRCASRYALRLGRRARDQSVFSEPGSLLPRAGRRRRQRGEPQPGCTSGLSWGRRSWNMDSQVWPLPRSFHPLGLSFLARSSALHPRLSLLSLSPDELQVCRPVAEVAQSGFDLAKLQLVGGRVLLGEPDVIKCKSLASIQGICSSGPD